jgi:hypothetical protein
VERLVEPKALEISHTDNCHLNGAKWLYIWSVYGIAYQCVYANNSSSLTVNTTNNVRLPISVPAGNYSVLIPRRKFTISELHKTAGSKWKRLQEQFFGKSIFIDNATNGKAGCISGSCLRHLTPTRLSLIYTSYANNTAGVIQPNTVSGGSVVLTASSVEVPFMVTRRSYDASGHVIHQVIHTRLEVSQWFYYKVSRSGATTLRR